MIEANVHVNSVIPLAFSISRNIVGVQVSCRHAPVVNEHGIG